MKKLLALSLAVVMVLAVSVTAFGWTWDTSGSFDGSLLTPGDEIEIPFYFFDNISSNYATGTGYNNFQAAVNNGVKPGDYNASVADISTPKKANLTATIDTDNNVVVLALKENYTMSLVRMSGILKLKPKSAVSSTVRYTYGLDLSYSFSIVGDPTVYTWWAGYPVLKAETESDLTFNYDTVLYTETNGYFGTATDFVVDWGKVNGTAKITWDLFDDSNAQYDDPGFYFEVKVNSSGKMNLKYTTKTNKSITQKYEDINMDFFQFPAAPTFDYTGTAKFYSDEDKWVYEIKDGKLYEVKTTYDSDEESYSFKTRTLGSYIISEAELDTAIVNVGDTDTNKNPDTGAHDFVNVAVALAVVSLAAAGAVVLKKK